MFLQWLCKKYIIQRRFVKHLREAYLTSRDRRRLASKSATISPYNLGGSLTMTSKVNDTMNSTYDNRRPIADVTVNLGGETEEIGVHQDDITYRF